MIGATVCTGIGCAELAAPEVDWVLSSEIDAFPRAVLMERLGSRPIEGGYSGGNALWGDFTAIRPRHLRRFGIPAPDLIVAGTPCQSFSIAGLRKGLTDPRGNLTLAFLRFCDAIDNLRRAAGQQPAFILWENVPGVLSDGGNAFGAFLAGLVGSASAIEPPRGRGWTNAGVVSGPRRCAAWRVLDAQHFGLAQRRQRVFVLARGGAGDWSPADALLLVVEGVRWDPAPGREKGQRASRPVASCARGGSCYRNDAGRADDLIAVDLRNMAVGDVGHTLQTGEGGLKGGIPHVTAYGGGRCSGPLDVATAVNAHGGPNGRLDFETETFVTHSLRADGFDASEDGTGRGIPLVPVAFHARQDPDSGPVTHPLDTDGSSIGVAFHENQRAEITLNDTAGSLKAGGGKPGQGYPAVHSGMSVRRLTPRECERLQGLPDNWTLITYRGKPAADGNRYRAIGNGMAVPCVRWILSRLAVHRELARNAA